LSALLTSNGALADTITYVTMITGASPTNGSDGDSVLQQVGTAAGYAAVADYASASTSVIVGFGWARGSAVATAGVENLPE